MSESPHKARLLDAMRGARARWDALIAPLDAPQMARPGVCGAWSLKDLIAHITWFEREMLGMVQGRALAGSDLWALPPDERNAAIFEQNRDRTLEDVRADSRRVFEALLQAVESLADEDLLDPGRFAGMPLDWQPLDVIVQNSCEHYAQHIPQVEDWLAKGA